MHNNRRSLCLAIAGLLVMTLSSFSHAEDRKIGVAVSAVINGNEGTGPEVSEALGAAIETVLKATVVAGADAQGRLPEAARSETCLGDSACLVSAGKALGVDELLMLIIIDSEEDVKVEATWVDVATGKTALRPSISVAKSSDAMAELFLANASSLLPDVELRPVDNVVVPPEETNSGDFTNNTGDLNNGAQQDTGSGGDHYFTPWTKNFAYASGGLLLLSGGLGVVRWVGCDKSFKKCDDGHTGLDTAADTILAASAVSLGIAVYLYLDSDTLEKAPALSISATDESMGFVYGGSF